VLVACAAPLFLGGLLSDIAYARTYEIQWLNFAAWLIAGAMVFTGLALAWSLVELALGPARRGAPLIGLLLLLAMFVFGLVNAFMHARDAWGAMPAGLLWSVIVTAIAAVALWISVSGPRIGAAA
jgi:uncharacterized membrane protein